MKVFGNVYKKIPKNMKVFGNVYKTTYLSLYYI